MIWLVLLPLCLVAEVVAITLAPFLALLVGRGDHLPRQFAWFDTPDNPTWGDAGHCERWAGKPRYLQVLAWLIRNRAYGFKLGPLGCPVQPYFLVAGDRTIGNRFTGRAGYLVFLGDLHHWYFKVIISIGFNYCIQLAFGWQLDAPINGRNLYMISPRITRFYRA